MNLAAIVNTAMRAVPSGLKGTVTISRVVAGVAYDAEIDLRAGDMTQTMANIDCVVDTADADAILPDGVDRTRVRDVTVAAAACTLFAPDPLATVLLNGKPFRVISVDPVAPDGVHAAAYTIRGVL